MSSNQAAIVAILIVLPASAQTSAPAGAWASQNLYPARIAPLLANRCGSCHGESKQKGGLALHTPQAIAKGGESGPIFVAGKPEKSEIVRRLRLPLDDDDHMPPRNKPQPQDDEIKAIEAWIAAGAIFSSPATAPAASAPAADRPHEANPPRKPMEHVVPPNPAAVAALSDRFIHVEEVAAGTNRLAVNFAAVATSINDNEVVKLLTPLLPQIEVVLLARCPVTDITASLLARAPRLRHLDLRGSRITDAGVAALSHLATLKELVLAQTKLSDASVEPLSAFPALARVYVWKSGLSPAGIARLRQQRPQLRVEAGDARPAATREVEPEFKLTSDAPLPQTKPSP